VGCSGCRLGGILWLTGQVVAHRFELFADFRAIYSVSADAVCGPELWALCRALLKDTGSRFHAAVAGWDHPLSREGIDQLHFIDLHLQRWSTRDRKNRPWPKPWDAAALRSRAERISDDRLLRALRPERFSVGEGEQVDPEGDGGQA
jgi:hypothetical protein